MSFQDDPERRAYVLGEVECLAGTDWPDNLARRLEYADANSLNAALHHWGRPDLAAKFERWRYDGLTPAAYVTQRQTRLANLARKKEAADG